MKKLIVTAILGAIAVSSMACPECDGCFGNHYGFCSEAEAVEQAEAIEPAEPIEKPKKEPKKYFWMSLGEFEITAYCGGTCCSSGTGITASGNVAEEGKTIGVDPDIIPLGSKVKIVFAGTEHVYRADDTGSAINGNIIDLYMGTAESGGHEKALQFGRQTCQVFIEEVNEPRN